MAERFRWVSRVSDRTGEPKRWTQVELEDGTLRVDGGAPMALSGLRRVTFHRHGNGEANHPFGRDTATLRLESDALRLELQGSLDPDVEGDPFPAVLARILTACAVRSPPGRSIRPGDASRDLPDRWLGRIGRARVPLRKCLRIGQMTPEAGAPPREGLPLRLAAH